MQRAPSGKNQPRASDWRAEIAILALFAAYHDISIMLV
jgi:hypothetical protein